MSHLAPFEGQTDRALARQKMEQNIELACRLLAQAGAAGCDIVCYPEDVQGIAHYMYYLDDLGLFTGLIETVPGPTTERIAEVARRRSMHVVFGIFEREGERLYNTAVLMGRKGEVLGKYHKVQILSVERWSLLGGQGFPVFQADFGTVGMLICYDIMFPEPARALVLNGAEILFNPTMGISGAGQCQDNGLVRVRMRALDNFVPFVVSKCGSETMIVDGAGNVVAQAGRNREEVISATVDLDGTPVDHSQWEVLTGTWDVKARFLQERLPEFYGDLTARRPAVLERYTGKRLRSTPEQYREAYEEIRRRWSGRSR
jgi:N-carbamoylputrescine amidase